ncbi:NUDIX hydrolase [Rhodoblastus sp.]|uniref:NUDIX hydrolase n=1 Tax=Rhodoblastus sp. TaxID=1962975 RepID=UPI003F950FED
MISKPRKNTKKVEKKVPSVKRGARERLQYAAMPWRITENGLEIMLVSSRETRRWIIPKGWPMAGRDGAAAAAIEALEEAGLLGVIAEKPLGAFHYVKRFTRGEGLCRAEVYPLRVVRQRDHWLEEDERETQWFPAAKAAKLVSDRGLGVLIRKFDRAFKG